MSDIDQDYKYLRVNLRKNGKIIAEDICRRTHPITPKNKEEICVFCKSTINLTREHVLPQWLIESNTEMTMTSGINKQSQTYYRAVIPTCAKCNNEVLSNIEENIIYSLRKVESKNDYFATDLFDVIRWLEILDYKLQAYDNRRKYIKYGNSEYDRNFGEFSLAMHRHFFEMKPYKAYNLLRQSQNRITRKSKIERLNSLLIFDNAPISFNFFNQANEYIFISFPMFKISIFYFLRKTIVVLVKLSKQQK